ncbi:MAG: hypothetical protein GY814_19060 [Gammaproteobacteria bacterium]|nr:hypothetical protein [Gammaproteobacteria bacterium]
MKIQTSKERRTQEQPLVPKPYRHPKALAGHVYMITNDRGYKGRKYYAVQNDASIWSVRLYNLGSGFRWSKGSTFGSNTEWKDITDKVYLNTDELEAQQ